MMAAELFHSLRLGFKAEKAQQNGFGQSTPMTFKKYLVCSAIAASIGLAQPNLALAEQSAVVQQILDGDQLFIDSRKAYVKERAITPQTLSTEKSRGQLLFMSGAIGRINKYSILRLGAACLLIEQGQMLVSGKQNACTKSIRLSVRGTSYIISVNDERETIITVLEGSISAEALDTGKPTSEVARIVKEGQKIIISPEGIILQLLELTALDYSTILDGPLFTGFSETPAKIKLLESHIRSILTPINLPFKPSKDLIPETIELPRRIPGLTL